MGFVVGEMLISWWVKSLLSAGALEGKEESIGDQTLGQLGWRGDNFLMISSSAIFLPPPEAAAPIPRGISASQAWILSSTPPILDDLWVENPGLDVLVLAAQQGKKKPTKNAPE